ncbi:hypothetical protein AB0H92_49340 [Streptomyces phaeochromogenes]|uniref:hypothetical protein n=1 Tax=Streptomyces phaeochromogenes TaxID=1923 RepID=UPI0033EBE061
MTTGLAWCGLQPDGDFRGTTLIEQTEITTPGQSRVTLRAQRPGKTRIRLKLGDCTRHALQSKCYADVMLSVPYFFFLDLRPEFIHDLARIGLARLSNPDGSPLTVQQENTTASAQAAVLRSALHVAERNLIGVNFRLLYHSAEAAVGAGNFGTVSIGGFTPPEVERSEYGVVIVDAAKRFKPDKPMAVFAGEFATSSRFRESRAYRAIFDPLMDAEKAVDAGDVVPSGPVASDRQFHIRAAIRAFGRFLGSVLAHEIAHALFPFGAHERGSLMAPGGLTFEEKTGVTDFDARRRIFVERTPIGFGPFYRECLPSLFPTGEIVATDWARRPH